MNLTYIIKVFAIQILKKLLMFKDLIVKNVKIQLQGGEVREDKQPMFHPNF